MRRVNCMTYYSRKSTRIPGYDYSREHYYFITICTHEHRCIFGHPERMNRFGFIAQNHILRMSQHSPEIFVDKFVVMPNHIHMILVIENRSGKRADQIIGFLKAGISREIRKMEPEMKIWQRSFHDHIIRNEKTIKRYGNILIIIQ